MAIGTVLIVGGLALALLGGKKKPRKALPSAPPTAPEEEPEIRWAAEEWFMPEGWLEVYATPRVQEYVIPKHQAGEEIDPLDVSLHILKGQTSAFPLPAAAYPPEGGMWQTEIPGAPDFYDGPASVLGLLYHVNEYVDEGISRWQADDTLYLTELGGVE